MGDSFVCLFAWIHPRWIVGAGVEDHLRKCDKNRNCDNIF